MPRRKPSPFKGKPRPHSAKLTPTLVAWVREEYATKKLIRATSNRKIAQQLGVSESTVGRITSGTSWFYAPGYKRPPKPKPY